MFSILCLHELGHLVFLKKYKREIISITFFPFGGIIKHSGNNNTNLKEDFYIHFGGLLVNIILLFIFHMFNMQTCLLINLGIIISNSIPIYPLDGGKILKTLLNSIICYKKSLYISSIISFISVTILLIINILFLKSYYIIFIIITLYNINIKYFYDIKKEYQYFLANKYIYPNEKLKMKKITKFSNPIDKIYQGRNSIFILDDLKIEEFEILKNHFYSN
ncbi:MAG: hypothetical protein R3Y60_02205 [bacterium]